MERRDLLKTVGGIGAASAAGGAGFLAMTGGAAAHGGWQHIGDSTVTSDDGSVEYVAIYGDAVVEWDGFDDEATQFQIVTEGRIADTMDEWVELNDTGPVSLSDDDWGNHDEELSGPGTSGTIETGVGLDEDGNYDPSIHWVVVGDDPSTDYGLPENSIDPSNIKVDDDGGSYVFTLQIKSVYTWYNSGGTELFSEDFIQHVKVEVNNRPSSANMEDGDGEDGAVAE